METLTLSINFYKIVLTIILITPVFYHLFKTKKQGINKIIAYILALAIYYGVIFYCIFYA